jgi:hypothetical protein
MLEPKGQLIIQDGSGVGDSSKWWRWRKRSLGLELCIRGTDLTCVTFRTPCIDWLKQLSALLGKSSGLHASLQQIFLCQGERDGINSNHGGDANNIANGDFHKLANVELSVVNDIFANA